MSNANYTRSRKGISCIVQLDPPDRFDITIRRRPWRVEMLHIPYGPDGHADMAWVVCRRDDTPSAGKAEPYPIRLKNRAPQPLLDLVSRYRPEPGGMR